MPTKIGEVIETNTTSFVAECYRLHTPPPLGSLVSTVEGELVIFGIVYNTVTESSDPGRRVVARGRDFSDVEDIYREHPQISKLLRTTFNSLLIGHQEKEHVRYYLPPYPPRVHNFVFLCDHDQILQFTQSLDFLSSLLAMRQAIIDEAICAFIRQSANVHDDRSSFLVKSGKQLATLLSGELSRLNTILRRIRP